MSKKPTSPRAVRRAADRDAARDLARVSVPILGYQRPKTTPPVMTRAERDARPKPMSKKNMRVMRGVFGAIAARRAEREADELEAAASEVD